MPYNNINKLLRLTKQQKQYNTTQRTSHIRTLKEQSRRCPPHFRAPEDYVNGDAVCSVCMQNLQYSILQPHKTLTQRIH